MLSDLVGSKLLTSDTPKGNVRLEFPSEVVERWFPGLYQPRSAAMAIAEVSVPAGAEETARMARELAARIHRRGWKAPDNFEENIAIYTQHPSDLAAMLQEVWRVDSLDDLLLIHDIRLPGMTHG